MQFRGLFTEDPELSDAVERMAAASDEERGAIFTRRAVVEFILDLAGYTSDEPLHRQRLLEPACGAGDFLLPAVERLVSAWLREGGSPSEAIDDLGACVRAIELHRSTCERTRGLLEERLRELGITASASKALAKTWLIQGDFLLVDLPHTFTTVVGNPPYVRQERIDPILLHEYRSRFRTLYDRADLYVPFIERSLSTLAPNGVLAFICADRWMKNRYGGPLRRMISERYRLKTYIDMVDTPAFHSEVIAYPAITIITREPGGSTRIAHRPTIDAKSLAELTTALTASDASPYASVRETQCVLNGDAPWLLQSDDQLAIVRRLERDFPAIEDAGCSVGIGVATGADKAFIGPYDSLDVEPSRKLPLVGTRDIADGSVRWQGLGVINPFEDDGRLADLDRYPRLRRYLFDRKEHIAGRHCARKAPAYWYRTIDRIHPTLTERPKLLIPDIKGEAHIVFEEGKLYPHHNLYYVTSGEWDLRALQAVLRSGIARLFVSTYSTRMRGGFLRFQAQYLRRIRIPRWNDVPHEIQRKLIAAVERDDATACTLAVFDLYRLSRQERDAIDGNGK